MIQTPDSSCGPRFRRFEQVTVLGDDLHGRVPAGACGTIVWADPPQKPHGHWTYCVCFENPRRYVSIVEPNLRSTGQFDSEDTHLGTTPEISHDLRPDPDDSFSFVEGTYRLPGRFWQVMVFAKADLPTLRHRPTTWPSGITGVVFLVPKGDRLDKPYVERAMSEAFDGDRWTEVQGPDSMALR